LSGNAPTGGDGGTSRLRADAIVVAAGASRRMGGTDKLAVAIGGRPLLAWTLEALTRAVVVERVVIVTAVASVDAVRAANWLPASVVAVVTGGERRHESVAAGLEALASRGTPEDRVLLVHDGARPAVRVELIEAVAHAAHRHGAAIPVLAVAETLKRVDRDRVVGTVERAGVGAAQTPQGIRLGWLREAYDRFPPAGPETWTDEAALLEACSMPVHAIPGHADNLKVTLPADLQRVTAILGAGGLRVGFGHDGHSFGPGEPLALAGVEVSGAPRLHGHSDGDVALHAVADALLGAAGLGDLGRIFPADARTPRGIAGAALVGDVVRRLRLAGVRPASLDVTILAARPRLGDRLDEMRSRIAALVELPIDRVNVKASTGNLEGMEGAGRGISARAVAIVEPDA